MGENAQYPQHACLSTANELHAMPHTASAIPAKHCRATPPLTQAAGFGTDAQWQRFPDGFCLALHVLDQQYVMINCAYFQGYMEICLSNRPLHYRATLPLTQTNEFDKADSDKAVLMGHA